jgi:hypothetical protein
MKVTAILSFVLVSALSATANPLEKRRYSKRGLSFNTVSTTTPFANS